MASIDDDRPTTSQIEKLNGGNYRSWATTMRAILRERSLFDIVDGTIPMPEAPADGAPTADVTKYRTDMDAWESKAMKACTILLSAIKGNLITYVEEEDNPATIWRILKERFRPTTDITLAQALKHLFGMRMAENGDMEAHVRDFTAAKRRVEEHSVQLTDIVYRTLFLLSMPTAYQMTVTALEGQSNVSLEAAQNRLLDDYRKRSALAKNGLVMSALHTNAKGHKGRKGSGNSHGKPSDEKPRLLCTHCGKRGHVASTCWDLHPDLKPKKEQSIDARAHIAFYTDSHDDRKASVIGNGVDNGKGHPDHWILDSGASEHFSPYRDLYERYIPLREATDVQTAKGRLRGIGIGSINVTVVDGRGDFRTVELKNVLHVPGMDSNLLSSNVLIENGFEINMHQSTGTNILKDGHIVATTVPHGKLKRLRTVGKDGIIDQGSPTALKVVGRKHREPAEPQALPYDTWHRRLAHLGPWNVRKLQQLADGITVDSATFPKNDLDPCEPCIQGHQTRNLNDAPMQRRMVPGDLVHSDICGWITPNSIGDARYFLTFIDDATRYTFLYPLKSKTAEEVRDSFLLFRNEFEQSGRRVKSIRTDGGGEYRKEMAKLCKELGIKHEETAPYTPEQNGVAERANGIICARIRSILAETGLPKTLWAELACTVVYLKNRSPTRSLEAKTPYEALHGRKPDLSHLVAVGTKTFVHIPKQKTKKMDFRSEAGGIMVGYGGSTQYRIWDPTDNKILVSASVRFIGEAKNTENKNTGTSGSKPIIYDEIVVMPEPRESPSVDEMEEHEDDDDTQESESDDSETIAITEQLREVSSEPETFESAVSTPQPSPRTQRIRKPKGAPFDPSSYVSAEHEARAQSHIAFKTEMLPIEPRDYEEVVNDPTYGKEWELAIKEEYDSLMKNGAWELVQVPPGKNIVSCKWVFKAKQDANGDVIRFKARLVARGFSQAYGVDYFETYAPVAKLTTCRTIFALAALEKWEIHGMDVITAYLLGKLDEEIYMMQPEGFEKMGMKRNMVCRLLRSLYGLKQAARVWNQKIHAFLLKIGFARSHADPCLYVDAKRNLYVTIWVDDLLIAGKDKKRIAMMKAQLSGEFEMKDLGELKHFLGMRIQRNANGNITIDQSAYIRQILERFKMEASKPVTTPLAPGSRLESANHAGKDRTTLFEPKSRLASVNYADIKQYQGMVGSDMYAMLCTRPDLAYAIQQLSQFNSNPTNAHFQAGKRVFRYLQGSQTTGLTYNGDITGPIQGYCDADYAANEDRKSISGYVFMLAGSPISWQAKKQTTVAQSTVEAEYAAMAHAAKEAIWLQYLLRDLGMSKYEPKVLYCDNQGAISLTKNPMHHAKTKHVDIQLHFIRDHVDKGTIIVEYCPTDDMLADLMTKGLSRDRHVRLLGLMGMGTLEVTNTMPSSSQEEGCSAVATSGSVELRGIHAAN
jgi:transposase InsO family protein